MEIALCKETAPQRSACSLIYKCSLLPASEVLSILEDTIGDYRCKDGNKVKALELMDKIDNSQSNEKSIESKDVRSRRETVDGAIPRCPDSLKFWKSSRTRLVVPEVYDSDALNISRVRGGFSRQRRQLRRMGEYHQQSPVVGRQLYLHITTVAKMSAPFRPLDEDTGLSIGLNGNFSELYKDTLNDGYSFLGIGMYNGTPQVKKIDARYIMFNGDDPTLDSTDMWS